MILLLLIPIFLLMYYPILSKTAPSPEVFLHLALIGIPIVLMSFQFTFLLTRPISLQLDNIIENLGEAKKEAERKR